MAEETNGRNSSFRRFKKKAHVDRKKKYSKHETFIQTREQLNDFHFIYTDGSKDGDRAANAVFYHG